MQIIERIAGRSSVYFKQVMRIDKDKEFSKKFNMISMSSEEAYIYNTIYMVVHYLATSISFENRGLAAPGSIDSVPVSADKEDYNSNGMWSARKAWKIVENAERIIAVELLCAAQAVDFHSEYKPGKGTQAAYNVIRSKVKMLKQDRIIGKNIQSVIGLIRTGNLVEAVEKSVGKLSLCRFRDQFILYKKL